MIVKRLMMMVGIVLALAACGTANDGAADSAGDEAATPTVEVLENDEAAAASDDENGVTVYEYTLDTEYDLPATWSGRAQFLYPSEWRMRDTSEGDFVGDFTLYAPDYYVINLSVNGDPQNDAERMESILDRLNQFAEIETREINGKTVLITQTRGGNAITAATMIDNNMIVFGELLSTRGRELEPMVDTMLDILLTFEPMAQDDE